MKVTLLQQDIVWANPLANIQIAQDNIQNAPPSDLYVLPEMWSTGFMPNPEDCAENVDVTAQSEALKWMQQMAQRQQAAIAGSLIVRTEAGACYNRFYFVTPDEVHYYDKRHLFTYGGEDKHFTAGDQRVVVEWRGVRFLLQVCYDLRFPVFSRNHPDEPYDVALYVASWPTSRIQVWRTLLPARAIENQCYVCGVNRVGSDPACDYCGGTMLIDAYGRMVDACQDNQPGMITAELNMDKLHQFRQKFPVLKDSDSLL